MLPVSRACAEVRPSALFGDNAVLQRDARVPVWGTAREGEVVTVQFQNQTRTTTARNGKWKVYFKKLQPGNSYEMEIAGDNFLRFTNVAVGDVWLCSGQSNMEVGMASVHNARTEVPAATHPNMRLFVTGLNTSFIPQWDVTLDSSNELQGHWQICTPQTIARDGTWSRYPGFTAVGYFFGREIQEVTGQPVGLIGSYYGGTLAEAWTSLEALKKNHSRSNYVARYESVLGESKTNSSVPPNKNTPSVLFNGMIAPLIPYALKGAIWYQGEQNASDPGDYAAVFKTMVNDWRRRWGLGDFPFLFVEIAGYHAPQKEPSEGGWALLREQQMKSLTIRNTAMASAMDLGAPFDVHPLDKYDVGHRLALAAEHLAYGKNLVYSGPIYASMKVEGSNIRIKFRNVGGGLKIGLPPWTQSGKMPSFTRLAGFAIAGADHKWVWADATIDGETLLVFSSQVKVPVAVRYGWASYPVCNLYNTEGLPASSFRTDNWPEN